MHIHVANLLLLVFLLSFEGSSSKLRPSPPTLSPVQAMQEKVLQKAQLQWKPADWKIIFRLEVPEAPPEDTYWGITYRRDKKIVIFVRPSYTVEHLATIYVHELAHVFVYQYMTEDMKAEWLRIRGLPENMPWSTDRLGNHGYLFGEEDFAECLSWTYQKSKFNSKLGPTPTKKQRIFLRKWMMGLSKKASDT